MGWFTRHAGRHSAYGVPDVTARRATLAAAPPVSQAAATPPPARLPDDRTTDQIGVKVADVLWGYYAQQPAASTPLAAPTVVTATPTYDDSDDSALLDFPDLAPPPVQPVPWERGFQPLLQPWPAAPTVAPAAVTPVFAPAPAPPPPSRFRVFERVATPPPAVSRLAVLEPRRAGVQLGFVDGTTLDLPRDDPAAKALRAAADALTLRE